MGRVRRISFEGGVYHVMNRGVDRQRIFFDDCDRHEFGRRLGAVHERFGLETIAYCLMTNHYHLVLRVTDGSLSDAMHHLGSVFTRHVNDRVGRDGPLFRGRFRSILVDTDQYLRWVVRYVHRNALDLPGVNSTERYRWSSMRTYLGLRPTPDFLSTDLVLGCFDGVNDFWSYHADDSPAGVRTIAEVDELDRLVEHLIAIDDLEYGDDDTVAPQGLLRAVRLALAVRRPDSPLANMVLDQIPTPEARSAALYRARRRMRDDDRITRLAERIETLIA